MKLLLTINDHRKSKVPLETISVSINVNQNVNAIIPTYVGGGGSKNYFITLWLSLNFCFSKMLASPSSRVTRLSLFEICNNNLSKKWPIVSKAHVVQNLWTFPFFTKVVKVITPFYKKCHRYRENNPRKQILVWYYILNVT